MYLKALDINGFKSFAKKGHFDFTSQISGIVGPNGSGKSNVAEAFRFVLGEQSLKNMRSKKGTDLIFAGKGGQLNRASVSVTFDNSKKQLDIDYNEVVIERVVLRDGSNEYYINKNKVRAKDVVELLAAANIGSTGHHIISQGEADKILMISPRDRKLVIEEALGLKVYTIKKNESVRKLDKTQDNLKEIKTEERATTPKLNYLRREVEKIERARELREELRALYRGYFPGKQETENKIADMHRQQEEVQQEIDRLNEQIRQEEQNMLDAGSAERKQGLEQQRKDLEQTLRAIRQEKNDIEREVGRLDAVIEIEEAKKKRIAEAPAQPSERRETVSDALHQIWRNWASTLMKEETLSPERVMRWQSRMVDYDQLPEESKDKDRKYADMILSGLGEERPEQAVFDPAVLEESQEKRASLLQKAGELSQQETELQPQLDVIEQELGSPELTTQKIKIAILEIEKQVGDLRSSYNAKRRIEEDLQKTLRSFETEEVHARDLFGAEADTFTQGNAVEDLNIHEKIIRTRALLESAGGTSGEEVIAQYQELQKRSEYIKEQVRDLEQTSESLNQLIAELDDQIEEKFRSGMQKINKSFEEFFRTLFNGGHAELEVINVPVGRSDDEDLQEYELGVEMKVNLPNKKISSLSMLSGGERSLTSIALLFAMSQVAPPPFIILDETDAALDEANSKRYGDMVEQLAQHSQLIVITHNRETMSRSGILYGVTMGDDGVSRLLSVSLEEAEAVAK